MQNEFAAHQTSTPTPTKIPFKITDACGKETETGAINRNHIVFGEEDSFMESESSEQPVEEGANKAKEVEEATEEETEEEEAEETEEMKKQRAIGEEDVAAWNPIGSIPKEGDVVAFKV